MFSVLFKNTCSFIFHGWFYKTAIDLFTIVNDIKRIQHSELITGTPI